VFAGGVAGFRGLLRLPFGALRPPTANATSRCEAGEVVHAFIPGSILASSLSEGSSTRRCGGTIEDLHDHDDSACIVGCHDHGRDVTVRLQSRDVTVYRGFLRFTSTPKKNRRPKADYEVATKSVPGACGKYYKSYSMSRNWRFIIIFEVLYMNIARAHAKYILSS
jgi:hypothetical protein